MSYKETNCSQPVKLFVTDLDGTLLANSGHKPRPGYWQRSTQLIEMLRLEGYIICYASGRHFTLARHGQRSFRIPEPDFWICDVGASIYARLGNPYEKWLDQLGQPFDHASLWNQLIQIDGLELQESEKQGKHKLSLYYSGNAIDKALSKISSTLHNNYESSYRIINSRANATGDILIDVLPENAGKANAMLFLAEQFSIPKEQIFFSGDSGNDRDALLSGVCSTIVGNAEQHLKDDLKCTSNKDYSNLYFANEFFGDGIFEGLCHHGLVSEKLEEMINDSAW